MCQHFAFQQYADVIDRLAAVPDGEFLKDGIHEPMRAIGHYQAHCREKRGPFDRLVAEKARIDALIVTHTAMTEPITKSMRHRIMQNGHKLAKLRSRLAHNEARRADHASSEPEPTTANGQYPTLQELIDALRQEVVEAEKALLLQQEELKKATKYLRGLMTQSFNLKEKIDAMFPSIIEQDAQLDGLMEKMLFIINKVRARRRETAKREAKRASRPATPAGNEGGVASEESLRRWAMENGFGDLMSDADLEAARELRAA